MTEESEPAKTRAAGARYPGASLAKVVDMLKVLDAAGGRASVGHIAPKLGTKETSSRFRSITAAARSFGLADFSDGNTAVFSLTKRGEAAIEPDAGKKAEALRAALVEPAVYRDVASRLGGRTVSDENLTEAFRLAGVSGAGASVAAETFLESARTAEAVDAGSVLDHDLPIPTQEEQAKTSSRPRPSAGVARSGAGAAARAPDTGGAGAQRLAPRDEVPRGGRVGITVNLDVSSWSVDQVAELIARLERGEPKA